METNKIIIFVTAVLIVISVMWEIYKKRMGKKVSNQLLEALYSGEFDVFDRLLADKRTQRMIPLFNREFLKLNKVLLQGDRRQVTEKLKEFDAAAMSREQAAAVHSKAFYFFLSCEDKKNATKYYHLLKENKTFQDHKNLERIYDTYILKGYRYLEEVEAEAGEDPFLLSMTADMYLNKGDRENFQKYGDLARKYGEAQAEKDPKP